METQITVGYTLRDIEYSQRNTFEIEYNWRYTKTWTVRDTLRGLEYSQRHIERLRVQSETH